MTRKIKSIALAVSMLIQIAANAIVGGLTAFADSGTVIGPYTITGGMRNIDYKLENDVLHILSDIPLTIANTDIDTASAVPIVVNTNVNGNITLAGVNIAPTSAAAIDVSPATQSKANVTITIADDSINILKGGASSPEYYAGLQKDGEYISENEGKLIIQGETNGTGKLIAKGSSYAAGIGSMGCAESGITSWYTSNIHIINCIIDATGGDGQRTAAIGTGYRPAGSGMATYTTTSYIYK